MARIFTRPPSREYDQGWDAIFAKKPDLTNNDASNPDLTNESRKEPEDTIADTEQKEASADLPQPQVPLGNNGTPLPGGGIRRPRGWTPGART